VGSVPGFIFVEPENYAEGRTEQEGGQYGPYADLTAHEIADYYGGDFHGHPYDADIELGCPLQKQHDAVSGAGSQVLSQIEIHTIGKGDCSQKQ
jgi:hypothetical protein